MPSPFPGMDPWLEDAEVFPNLHDRLIVYLQDALNAAMPEGYVAISKNRVWIGPELQREPDVRVFGRERDRIDGGLALATLAGAGLVELVGDAVTEPWEELRLEIRSNRGKRLVTAVEILSRANKKPGDAGRTSYRQKQGEYLASAVNLVEIDLLRGGRHTTAVPEERLRAAAGSFDYHISTMLAMTTPHYFVATVALADRLPRVQIPLDRDVEPVAVELQPLLDRCYDAGRYTELFDYHQQCEPPLTAEQQVWAEGVLRAKGILP